MKMTPQHFSELQEAMHRVLKEHSAIFNAEAYKSAGLSEKRLRWDVLKATGTVGGMPEIRWICDVCYPYLHDEHLDTALRQCMDNYQALQAKAQPDASPSP